MPTLTQTKRLARPQHYARKDTRTRVYALVYGTSTTRDPQGDPALNLTRKHIAGFEPQAHEQTLTNLLARAAFPPSRERALLAHFDQLKRSARAAKKAAQRDEHAYDEWEG